MRPDCNYLLRELLDGLTSLHPKVLVDENLYAKLKLRNGWFVLCEGDQSSAGLTLYIAPPGGSGPYYAVWLLMRVFEQLTGNSYGAPTVASQSTFLIREARRLFSIEQDYSAAYRKADRLEI